jgi:predicted nucleic acid-binding protein
MSRLVLLDAGPLGMIAHPRRDPAVVAWYRLLKRGGIRVAVPEIADYEVRRELLRANLAASIARLDVVKSDLPYFPITTEIMLRAAVYWAQVRRQGVPTAPDLALDADVILAATVAEQAGRGDDVVLATTNPRHLSRLVPAQLWHEIVS